MSLENIRHRIFVKSQINKICLFGLLLLMTSCNRTSHLLPKKYKITKEQTFDTAISYGRILKVKQSIHIDDLQEYPKEYKKNIFRTVEKPLVKWTKLNSLVDKKGIIFNVRQTLEFGDYQQINKLLTQIENYDNEIYFAGLGEVMKGLKNEKHNFYQFMYFLDIKTNEIFELDDIH
ncbi:hypothetical protein PbJCM13498_39430 [Prolixibacter bellariivorans]|uniref:Lipoprotein n=1 Tax=Prolixibacter bellariivorans TaxID=314319 RepID=A0A5M4B4S4_9BACT|nr:hypothetical protein [Prolixibacter bellariivorans]GET35080.1 hypothetical protein PbJCM13498_39430 [Prolixibacter bellariivorans]